MPSVADLDAMERQAGAAPVQPGAAPPAGGGSQGFVPTIDVGPGAAAAPMGQMGSQYAPSYVAPGGVQGAPPIAAPPPTPAAPFPVPPAPAAPAAPVMAGGLPWQDPSLAQKFAEPPAAPAAPGAPRKPGERTLSDLITGSGPAGKPGGITPNDLAGLPDLPPAGSRTGYASNVAAGAYEGIAGVVGMPADLTTMALNLGARALGLPQINDPIMGSEWLEHNVLGAIGLDPSKVVPQTEGEYLARAAARGLTSTLAFGGVGRLAMLARPWMIEGRATQLLPHLAATPPGLLVAGTVGGVTGALAGQAVPEEYRPIAEMLGDIAGGFGTVGVQAAAAGGRRLVGAAGRRMFGPLGPMFGEKPVIINPDTGQPYTDQFGNPIRGTPTQAQMAGTVIARAAGETPAEAAANVPTQPANVPGQATMGQLRGNQGLLNFERTQRTRNRAPHIAIEAANNTARAAALVGLQPGEAASAASDFFLRRLSEIEAETPAERQAIDAARVQAEGLPTTTPAEAGAEFRERIAALNAPKIAGSEAKLQIAEEAARRAVRELGGGPETRLADVGGTQRKALAAIDQAKDDQVNRLADAVDPRGIMPASGIPITDEVKLIDRELANDRYMAKPDGDTAKLLDLARSEPPNTRFRTLRSLRSAITTGLRIERGNPNPTRATDTNKYILGRLLRAVDKAMADAVGDVAEKDAEAVRQGALPFTQTVGGRMAAASPDGNDAPETVPRVGTEMSWRGRPIDVRYEVVNGSDLVTSHDAELNVNRNYPQELQPRQRDRQQSRLQVQKIANELRPQEVGASEVPNFGAPIIGPDNVVEVGNGRVLGIRQAYRQTGPQVAAYRDYLARNGFPEAANMDEPILVRRRLTELSPGDRVLWAQDGNADRGLQYTAGERAGVDATRLTPNILALWRGGEVGSVANNAFVRAFVRNVAAPGEEGGFITEGGLSKDGAERIRNALLQRAYGERDLVTALTEGGDEDIKAFGGALMDSAGNMARLKAAVENGTVPAQFDIAGDLTAAARIIQRARSARISLADAVNQPDAFSGAVPERVRDMLQMAFGPQLRGRMSRARMSAMLEDYARLAGEANNLSLLPQTRADLLREAEARNVTRRVRGAAGEAAAQRPGTLDLGQGGGESRPTERGPAPSEAGAGPAGPADAGGREVPAPKQVGRPGASIAPEPAPQPVLPDYAASVGENYAAMRAARLERGTTYEEGPVGAVLAPSGRPGEYVMQASRVAPRLFHPGAGSAEDIAAFVKAVGGRTDEDAAAAFRPLAVDKETGAFSQTRFNELMQARRDAIEATKTAAAFSLRSRAEEGGMLKPADTEAWLKDHAAALDAFPELREAYRNAAAATQQYKDILATRKAMDQNYPLAGVGTDAELALRYWKSGPMGAESVQRFIRDTQGSPLARQTLGNMALADMRDYAFKNGEWSQSRFDTWMNSHKSGLSELPEVADQLRTFGDAQNAAAKMMADRLKAIKDYQASAASFWMTKTGEPVDPQAAMGRLMGSPTSPRDAVKMVRMASRDPAALAGMKRAALDWVAQRVTSTAEAGVTGGFELRAAALTRILQNAKVRATLTPIIGSDGLKVMDGVAESMALQARAQTATAIKGSPGTAADLHSLAEDEPHAPSLLTQMAIAEIGGEAIKEAVNATGKWGLAVRAAAFVGTRLYNAAREAGMKNVYDLAQQGVLQPEFGRYLLQRAVTNPKSPILPELARRIAVLSATATPYASGHPRTMEERRQ